MKISLLYLIGCILIATVSFFDNLILLVSISLSEVMIGILLDKNVAKISVIGMGMMSQSGVAEKMFKTLAKNAINILAISTSEIKISVLIDKKYTNIAVKSLHEVYNL